MFIKKVELENIKKFDKACIEFSSGVNFISGRNGAGKTTLIESIGYAIFGAPVSNKGFLAYLLKKDAKQGRIRVTFLDKNNNELIADRKITKTSSNNVWAIKKVVDDSEEVVASGITEVMSYLKDALEFYPDDDMSQIYEKIVSVPQGEITAAFFGTDKSRKDEFDPLFKLDSYRRAFERIKLIKSINDENIALQNDISKNEGVISSKDELIKENEKLKEDKKNKEQEQKKYLENSKEINEKFNILDKVKKEIESIKNETNNKKLEFDKFNSLKTKVDKDIEDINKASEIIRNTKDDFTQFTSLEKDINEKEISLKKLEEAKNNFNQLKSRVDNGNAKVEERKRNLEKQNTLLEEDKKVMKEYEEKIKTLNEKIKDVKVENKENVDLDKLSSARDRLLDLISDLKIKENDMKKMLLGNNQGNKEILYLNTAQTKINKIKDTSDGEIKNLAIQASENLLKAIELTKEKEDSNDYNDVIADKDKIEKEISNIIIGYVKDDLLLEKFNEDNTKAKELFDEYYNKVSKNNTPNEEAIKLNLEIENANKQIDIFKNKIESSVKSINADTDEMNHWIEGIKGIVSKMNLLKDDADNYENAKKEIDELKKKQNTVRTNYELYLQNVKKLDDKDNLVLEQKNYIDKIETIGKEIKELESKLNDSQSKFDEEEYKNVSETLEKIKENAKIFDVQIGNINKDIERITNTLKDFENIEKEIEVKKNEINDNNDVIEVVKKLRNVINDAPEAISNILIQSISNRASDIYSDIATDTNRLEWENSYDLVLYDYLNGEEIKKEFKQLSGGEQMTAALSIRLAMLENLTKLKIGILDEPTTNIDSSRREKLADIVSNVAENFNQLFVVSHDDTFENITQNVVALTGGSNNE